MKQIVLKISVFAILIVMAGWSCSDKVSETKSKATVGVYYFDGWAGTSSRAGDPNEPWAANAPTHLTRRMIEEFPGREPVWGWRDDSLPIMEKQIDLAADNGVDFFLFCWYWRDNKGSINPDAIDKLSLHSSMNLLMEAKNRNRIKYSLLVANHGGSEIIGTENWGMAVKFWMKYFKDPQYMTVDGKPLVVIFNTSGIDNEALSRMQEVAKEEGLKGLSIAGCGNTAGKLFDIKTHYNINPGYSAGTEEHSYAELVEANKKGWSGTLEQPYIPIITIGWDKRPWEGPTGLGQKPGWYYTGRTPDQVRNYLRDAVQWLDDNPKLTTKERIVLIYAWNENGEGGYIVPTKEDPDATCLKIIREVFKGE